MPLVMTSTQTQTIDSLIELPTRASMMKSARIGRMELNTGNQEMVFTRR